MQYQVVVDHIVFYVIHSEVQYNFNRLVTIIFSCDQAA